MNNVTKIMRKGYDNSIALPTFTTSVGTFPISASWYDSIYANGKYMFVGLNNTQAITSTDGNIWNTITLPSATSQRYSIAYGNGIYVCLADTNNIIISFDGITWSIISVLSRGWNQLSFGNGVFVMMAEYSGSLQCATSSDGINWNYQTLTALISQSAQNSIYANGLFIFPLFAQAIAMISPDGVSWTEITLPISGQWRNIKFGNGIFVMTQASSSVYLTSIDGINWTTRSFAISLSGEVGALVFGNGIFVYVRYNQPNYVTSDDGINWTTRSCLTGFHVAGVYGNGKFIFPRFTQNTYLTIT
jgi:hypothetical protein